MLLNSASLPMGPRDESHPVKVKALVGVRVAMAENSRGSFDSLSATVSRDKSFALLL